MALNDTLDQLDLIDIYRTFHPKTAEYTFLSSSNGMLPRIDHMLGHKTNLKNLKRIKIISIIFYSENGMKLEINYRKKNGKNINLGKLKHILLKNQWVNEGNQRENQKMPRDK